MNKIIKASIGIIALILMTLTTTYAQSENNCNQLHRGTFTYGYADDVVKVVFKKKKHIEYHGKYYIKSKLVWVNDCEYNMTMKKVTIPDFPFGKGDVMNVKINKVEGDKIYYTSTVNGLSFEGMFTKIE